MSGANILDGGTGADTMTGGSGNDTYVVDKPATSSPSWRPRHRQRAELGQATRLAPTVENLTLTGAAAIDGTGNVLANVLIGNGGDNILDGGAGADTMNGGDGNDTYVVDNAGDVVVETVAGDGTDLVAELGHLHPGRATSRI